MSTIKLIWYTYKHLPFRYVESKREASEGDDGGPRANVYGGIIGPPLVLYAKHVHRLLLRLRCLHRVF